MSDPDHQRLDLLLQGVATWNAWRQERPDIQPDLRGVVLHNAKLSYVNLSNTDLRNVDFQGANLLGANLYRADLSNSNLRDASFRNADFSNATLSFTNLKGADLRGADLRMTNFSGANLSESDLREVDFRNADLSKANLTEARLLGANLQSTKLNQADLHSADLSLTSLNDADLREADLRMTNFSGADLKGADLRDANLIRASLVETDLSHAKLTGCRVYGISAWDVRSQGAIQDNLVITPPNQPIIMVDNLKVAQFLYLLLSNEEIREVIDTIAKKAVLLLGRFTSERKVILDAIRDELRKRNYLPIVFDFDEPASRDVTETVTTLARLSRFIIADITDPRSIPQELSLIVPTLPSVPVQPLLHSTQREYGMFSYFTRYPWVLPIYHYSDQISLLLTLMENVISPAEQKARELEKR